MQHHLFEKVTVIMTQHLTFKRVCQLYVHRLIKQVYGSVTFLFFSFFLIHIGLIIDIPFGSSLAKFVMFTIIHL